MNQQCQAVHIPSSYTKETPTEAFDPSDDVPRSHCTWHTLISSNLTPTDSMSAGIATLPAGTGCLCPHRHKQAEIYYIISGSAAVTVNGTEYPVNAGSTFFVPGDAEHGIRNNAEDQDMKWFYVFPTGSFGDVTYVWSDKEKGGQE